MKMGGQQILTTVTTKKPGKEQGGLEATTNTKKSTQVRSHLRMAGTIVMTTMTMVAK
jgi:hypothetical protein